MHCAPNCGRPRHRSEQNCRMKRRKLNLGYGDCNADDCSSVCADKPREYSHARNTGTLFSNSDRSHKLKEIIKRYESKHAAASEAKHLLTGSPRKRRLLRWRLSTSRDAVRGAPERDVRDARKAGGSSRSRVLRTHGYIRRNQFLCNRKSLGQRGNADRQRQALRLRRHLLGASINDYNAPFQNNKRDTMRSKVIPKRFHASV